CTAQSRSKAGASGRRPRSPPAVRGWVNDSLSRRQVAARIAGGAVDAHLVVEMRTRGAARSADGADRLTATHRLALAHVERGEMAVERVDLAAVSDDDDAAVARVAPGEDHGAVAGPGHRRAVARRDVDAGVH